MGYSRKLENLFKSKKIKIGDRITITRGKKKFQGMLLPKTELDDENSIVIKLDSGYNIGIKYQKGVRVKRSRTKEPKEIKKEAEFEFGKWHASLKKKMKFDPKKPLLYYILVGRWLLGLFIEQVELFHLLHQKILWVCFLSWLKWLISGQD